MILVRLRFIAGVSSIWSILTSLFSSSNTILSAKARKGSITLTAVFQADIRQKTIAGDSSGDDGSQDGVGIIQ